MRVSAMIMAVLALGLASRSVHGQTQAAGALALRTIHMIDAQTGWAVLINGGLLLRTTDGGTYWRGITPGTPSGRPIRVGRITALSSLTAWVSQVGPFGSATTEVFRTFDGGRTWRSTIIPALEVKAISFLNSREGWLIAFLGAFTGREEVEIYHSTDGAESWFKVASATLADSRSGLPVGGDKSDISFLNPTTGWITGFFAQPGGFFLYVTHDGGHTWRQQKVPVPREMTPLWGSWPLAPKFFAARDGILPVFYDIFEDSLTPTGRVVAFYATHDGGTTWTHTTPVRVNVTDQAYQAVDMNHAWVLNGGVLQATNDGGRRWMPLPRNPLFVDVTQLDFISPKIGWAVRNTAPYGGRTPTFPFLLKTVDGGRTWNPVQYSIVR